MSSPTGIDRVTEAYGRWLLSRHDVRLIPVCTIGGVASPMSLSRFRRILEHERPAREDADVQWRRLGEALSAAPGEAATLRAVPGRSLHARAPVRYGLFGAKALASLRATRPGTEALYLNVSHYGLEQPRVLERLAVRGARMAAMIHDLIPIVHPEYCSAPAAGWHVRRVETLLRHDSVIIANSRSTAQELRAFAQAHDLPEPRVFVAPLGLEPVFTAGLETPPTARPYFVCVGTIEPRKNVAFLLTLWRSLAERMGEKTPWLVLAGRRGWENEAIIDHLERSPPIRRFVHEVNDLTDNQLASLIKGANALLAPSFAEGFNLPVAEAAALGTPVIASDIAVHRELALHAGLLDPTDGPAWLTAIQAAAQTRVRGRVATPFSWDEHFAIAGRALGLANA
jgi:glycosyltransferase involved in cell wall biosynthesis